MSLGESEIHVWRAELDAPAAAHDRLKRHLSPDELARASRFVFEEHRRRFVAARGILRDVLARYLGCTPAALQFRYGRRGKPEVDSGGLDLRFNLSHSGGVAVVAVARGREVGIDVERIRPEAATDAIARRFFSPREVEALAALPPKERLEAFFRCWTRKEAYIKARGEGLRIPLSSFDVSVGREAALLAVRGAPEESSRWTLAELQPGPSYAGALAYEGDELTLTFWDWAPGTLPAPDASGTA